MGHHVNADDTVMLMIHLPIGLFTFSCKGHHCSSKSARFSSCLLISVRILVYWAFSMLTDTVTAILVQRIFYGTAPPAAVLIDDDDLEQALALAEE